jgi:hypothetical protein
VIGDDSMHDPLTALADEGVGYGINVDQRTGMHGGLVEARCWRRGSWQEKKLLEFHISSRC